MNDNAVEQHYSTNETLNAIRGALETAGKDIADLKPEDLAGVDEFHVRGREASLELAAKLAPTPETHVLDVGSGVGGPSRLLADNYGCRVTGIDLTAGFCEAATALAGWVGLGELVDYRQGDATAMPFEDAAFDAAWTQHVAMNIPAKDKLYGEVRRVLKPGGTFAIYDVMRGAGDEVLYPVPWARTPDISHLVTPSEIEGLLAAAGFEVVESRDTTELGWKWFVAMAERVAKTGAPPPLGFHLLLGPEFRDMAGNIRRNLEEGRTALVEIIARAV